MFAEQGRVYPAPTLRSAISTSFLFCFGLYLLNTLLDSVERIFEVFSLTLEHIKFLLLVKTLADWLPIGHSVFQKTVNPLSLWCRTSDKLSGCRVAREHAKPCVHISDRHTLRPALRQMGHPFFHRRLYLEAVLFHYSVAFLSPPLHFFPP